MSKELQDQLAALLSSLQGVAGQAVGFAKAQLPPLVQEKILLGRFEDTILVVMGFLLLTIVIPLVVAAVKLDQKGDDLFNEAYTYRIDGDNGRASREGLKDKATRMKAYSVMSGVCALVSCVAGPCLFFGNFHEFLLVWFAPRLFIVEWLTSLVKK